MFNHARFCLAPVRTQFLQISTVLPEGSSVYGLGENTGPFELSSNPEFYRMSLFARDVAPGVCTPSIFCIFLLSCGRIDNLFFYGQPPDNNNLYGAHAFALIVAKDGRAHGVFLYNSNAMETQMVPSSSLTYRALGGGNLRSARSFIAWFFLFV
jgi:lysosomal alpha-glucosidase